jgi:hypothetical protein
VPTGPSIRVSLLLNEAYLEAAPWSRAVAQAAGGPESVSVNWAIHKMGD